MASENGDGYNLRDTPARRLRISRSAPAGRVSISDEEARRTLNELRESHGPRAGAALGSTLRSASTLGWSASSALGSDISADLGPYPPGQISPRGYTDPLDDPDRYKARRPVDGLHKGGPAPGPAPPTASTGGTWSAIPAIFSASTGPNGSASTAASSATLSSNGLWPMSDVLWDSTHPWIVNNHMALNNPYFGSHQALVIDSGLGVQTITTQGYKVVFLCHLAYLSRIFILPSLAGSAGASSIWPEMGWHRPDFLFLHVMAVIHFVATLYSSWRWSRVAIAEEPFRQEEPLLGVIRLHVVISCLSVCAALTSAVGYAASVFHGDTRMASWPTDESRPFLFFLYSVASLVNWQLADYHHAMAFGFSQTECDWFQMRFSVHYHHSSDIVRRIFPLFAIPVDAHQYRPTPTRARIKSVLKVAVVCAFLQLLGLFICALVAVKYEGKVDVRLEEASWPVAAALTMLTAHAASWKPSPGRIWSASLSTAHEVLVGMHLFFAIRGPIAPGFTVQSGGSVDGSANYMWMMLAVHWASFGLSVVAAEANFVLCLMHSLEGDPWVVELALLAKACAWLLMRYAGQRAITFAVRVRGILRHPRFRAAAKHLSSAATAIYLMSLASLFLFHAVATFALLQLTPTASISLAPLQPFGNTYQAITAATETSNDDSLCQLFRSWKSFCSDISAPPEHNITEHERYAQHLCAQPIQGRESEGLDTYIKCKTFRNEHNISVHEDPSVHRQHRADRRPTETHEDLATAMVRWSLDMLETAQGMDRDASNISRVLSVGDAQSPHLPDPTKLRNAFLNVQAQRNAIQEAARGMLTALAQLEAFRCTYQSIGPLPSPMDSLLPREYSQAPQRVPNNKGFTSFWQFELDSQQPRSWGVPSARDCPGLRNVLGFTASSPREALPHKSFTVPDSLSLVRFINMPLHQARGELKLRFSHVGAGGIRHEASRIPTWRDRVYWLANWALSLRSLRLLSRWAGEAGVVAGELLSSEGTAAKVGILDNDSLRTEFHAACLDLHDASQRQFPWSNIDAPFGLTVAMSNRDRVAGRVARPTCDEALQYKDCPW